MNLLPASAFGDSSICAIFGNRQNQSFTLAFRRSGNKCFYVSGIKKASPRFSAGTKKGLRRKKAAQEGGWRKNISRETQSCTRAETLRIAESTAAQHFSRKRKGICLPLLYKGRPKKEILCRNTIRKFQPYETRTPSGQ